MKIIDINSIPRNLTEDAKTNKGIDRPRNGQWKGYLLSLFITLATALTCLWFFYLKPTKNLQAEDAVFQSIYYFEAGDFDKALQGDGVHKGLLEVIADYPNTTTANLSCLYAGIAYMHQKAYDKALPFLSKFKADDFILQARGWCVMGDAYSQQKNYEQAATYYMKAAGYKANSIYTPDYLVKAAIAFEANGEYKKAYDCYQSIIKQYPNSKHGKDVAIKESSRLSVLF